MFVIICLLCFALFAVLSWLCFQMLVKSKTVHYEVVKPDQYEKNFDMSIEDMIKYGIIIEHLDYHYPVYFTLHRIFLVCSASSFVISLIRLIYEQFASC